MPIKASEKSLELSQLAYGLSKGTNYVEKLLDKALIDPQNETQYYFEAARLSCRMLEEVISNVNFRQGVKKLAIARQENNSEFDVIVRVEEEFEKFLEKERRLIEAAGLRKVDDLIDEYRQVRQDVLEGKARSGDVYEAIERIK